MRRCGFGVKVRQETSSVSLCQPQAPHEAGLFSELQIDHFVMAITAAKATAWHIAPRQMALVTVLS
jgi:hypothetical protein